MLDVIIPVKNSESVLENCLKTLRVQTNPVNLIIVDAHSTDKTVEIAKKYGCLVVEEPPSNVKGSRRAVACNEGVRHSKSEYVAFLDSDTEVLPNWSKDMEETMKSFDNGVCGLRTLLPSESEINCPDMVAAITSGCEPDMSSRRALAINRVMKLASNHARKYTTITEVKSVPGYNAVYRRSAIQEVGYFTEEVGGCEDWEINSRLRKAGYVLLGVPQSPVVHKERATYKAFSRQMVGYGWSWARLLRVKHIFLLSRAIPLLTLIFGIIGLLYFLSFFSLESIVIGFAMGFTLLMLTLSEIPEEVPVFIIMQLSLAFGYFRGLFL